MLGRDATLTGRTDLWNILLREPINPLVGTGYQSFWLSDAAQRLWETHPFHPNQAHNGYLETYLNGGLAGVLLLLGMIVSPLRGPRAKLLGEGGFTIIRFAFLFVGVFYNWTEATFNKLSPMWFIVLLAVLEYRRSSDTGLAPE